MIEDPYIALAVFAQAQRREAERHAFGLGGVLGVAAEPYPHQLATAARILGDVRVRHLIADEVGLGKTVQALMVLNALRLQQPNHSAVIVAPDRLIEQWQSECWTRCHVQASVFEDAGIEDARVRLVRPQSLASGTFSLNVETTDLLLVDEPQTMPIAALDVIERVAPDVRQLLVLSATPGLSDTPRRLSMMRLLEPERVRAAELRGMNPLDALDDLDHGAAGRSDLPASQRYDAFCRTRRVIRSSRSEWGRYLPERLYSRVDCRPLEPELDRIRDGLRWADEAAGPTLDRMRFAQALHRSRQSARQVLRDQPRKTARLNTALEAAAEPGDSRLDALIDQLTEIWSRDAEAQVVVVAGDNPTIDHLQAQLPRYLSPGGEPLVVEALRRAGETLESEVDDIRAMHEQLGTFVAGDARVLLIGDWIQAGLNLQHFSGHIILHNPPWEPETVDQLIGRLDRLRPGALATGDRGQAQPPVRIVAISQEGTPSSAVVDALEALDLFRRPMPPVSSDDMAAIREGLSDIARSGAATGVMQTLRQLSQSWSEAASASPLEGLNPHTAERAQEEYNVLSRQRPLEPAMERSLRRGFFQRREEALRGWTDLLSRSRLLAFGSKADLVEPEFRFSTVWYPDRRDTAPLRISELDAGPTFISGHQPFLWRRSGMMGVPRRLVATDEGEENGRPLRFLDDGDALHDALVSECIQEASRTLGEPARPKIKAVRFPEGHPILALQGKTLLLLLGWADPLLAYPPLPLDELRRVVAEAPTEAQRATLQQDLTLVEEGWRADRRWLSQQTLRPLRADLSVLDGSVWSRVEDETLTWSAFKPFAPEDRQRIARSAGLAQQPPSPQLVAAGLQRAAGRIQTSARAALIRDPETLRRRLQERIGVLRVEADDAVALREAEARRAGEGGGHEQLQQGRVAAVERRLAFGRRAHDARVDALVLGVDRLREVVPGFRSLLIRPARLEV